MAKITPEPGSRRERQRQELLDEIGEATREIVVEEGAFAVTMAAVAERVGVTAPALYRYVDGRTGLLELGCVTIVRRLLSHLTAARDTFDDPLERVLGLFRELRRWALDHRAEFALVFASPATAYERAAEPGRPLGSGSEATSADLAVASERELEWLLEEALIRLWQECPFRTPAVESSVPDELHASVRDFVDRVTERAATAGLDLPQAPTGAAAVLLGFWVRVYGMISMEVFGHLSYAVGDGEPLFEFVLDEFARTVRGGNAPPRDDRA